MSRLSDALLVLFGKCTPEGTKPEGDNIDDMIRCLSEHFNPVEAGQYLVTVTKTDGVYKADKTFAEIKKAADQKKVLRCLCDGSYYDVVSATSNVIRFSRVLHRVADDASTIAEMSLIAVEINPADGVIVVGRGITAI